VAVAPRTLYALARADRLVGGPGFDGPGFDRLVGSYGNDRLVGDGGLDDLIGWHVATA
jgi:hypothetical protein